MINISMKKFVQLDLIGIGISGVLQLVGYLTPGWVLMEYTSTYQSHSVWYRIECTKETHTSCVVKYISYSARYDGHTLMIGKFSKLKFIQTSRWPSDVGKDFDTTKYLKTVTTLALVSCLAVFVLLIKMKPCPEAAMLKRLPICAYLSLLSGILWVVPAGQI
ncbi:uncharacterized protein LOC132725202 isoform X1 [Ruditapes philippinarum]|uniref:uncharacterized protein LOC132725202 isoform X1 n=1 Tax=Ruditapes philippinarum TaxID=129788 RepID=UPI00295ABDCD|nr:uncharacterized protein LOC132725202 isoform X1 [Ruditapes philippinarum]